MNTAAALIYNLGFVCVGIAVIRLFQDPTPFNPRVLFWLACCYTCWTTGNALTHAKTGAIVSAVLCGIFWWLWWISGGGKNTKRRLLKAARAFKGVRRTAPVMT